MITLLREETSIVDVQNGSFLELTWKLDSRFGIAHVEIYLDPSMYAIPATHQDGVAIGLTYPAPTVSLEQSSPIVSENRKVVTFKIHNVSLYLDTKGTVQKKQIPFEWRNPNKIPEGGVPGLVES